jgi:hypothetical protein
MPLLTNLYPNRYDPYNTPYEGVNWAEVQRYYPPNGIRYINPYQGGFPPTDTRQLKQPYVVRQTATALDTFSLYESGGVLPPAQHTTVILPPPRRPVLLKRKK